ncbi:MAG TPA: LCP family protein [Candidatus Rothia avicola]|uniref:LCP family protein n=1 Tax=Candidatus Rothia avicola TaxID=2840478 RepID=A0A9D2CR31_9MICC|nr:LCP family protein [Candidatus Rothia avicola]
MAPQGQPPQRVVTPLGRHMRNQPLKSQRVKWIALSCVALLAMVVAFSGFALVRLRSNVQTAEMNIGELSADLASGPLDILVIGSDTRAGNNGAYGTAEDAASGARSDVMMLVQVSEDRSNVNVISFPRDLMVDIPKCTDAETGEVYPATTETQINESLERGGPGCTVATISNLTGVAIDHFMLVDFNAVKALSSVVGGVEVCVTEPIDDTYSGLKLPAGTSSVEGEQALAFLRSRHGFGDGSDTARIQAQQSFLASLLRKVQAEGTLTNPAMLLNIAEAITQNVTVDKELTNLGNLVSIGSIFANIDLSKVVFATVPNEPYVYDENKLQLSADTEAFFTKLQNDESLVEPTPAATASASDSSAPAVDLTYSLGVSVTDATGIENRAEELAPKIEQAGFTSVTVDTTDALYTESAIYYPYGYDAEAQAIAGLFGITSLTPSDQYVGIAVILGSDLAENDTIAAPTSEIAAGATGQTADQVTCQQSFSY